MSLIYLVELVGYGHDITKKKKKRKKKNKWGSKI